MQRGTNALASQNPAPWFTILLPCQREAPPSPCYQKLGASAFSKTSSNQAVLWEAASSPVPRVGPPARLLSPRKTGRVWPQGDSGREPQFLRPPWQTKGTC